MGSTADLVLALIVGGLLLLAPGAALCAAFGWNKRHYAEEAPALWLALSLGLFSVPALASTLTPVPVYALAPAVVAAACVAAVVALRRRTTGDFVEHRDDRVSLPVALCALGSAVFLTAAAYAFTRGGSIDRWWYLAFIRGWIEAGAVSPADPFFGAGTTMARFAGNAWLTALACWTHASGAAPWFLYERAAPLLLAPIALSAAAFSTRVVLGSRRLGWFAAIAAVALWTSGGMFPAMARLPEDKMLGILVLGPVLWGAVVQLIDEARDTRDAARPSGPGPRLFFVAVIAVALASVHPLAFAITLLLVFPALLGAPRRTALALAVLLTVVAVLPASTGRDALVQLGAESTTADSAHPVARIHEGRERVREVDGALRVELDALAHPLTATAIVTAMTFAAASARTRLLLTLPTILGLALCFVPAFATALGRVIGPWMVYRLVWAVPAIALLSLLAGRMASYTRLGLAVPIALLLIAAAPGINRALDQRSADTRQRLATPVGGEFPDLVRAIEGLPRDVVVAAAPELSERLPGLTGRHVLAASDRATMVFSASADDARIRLRARAALLAGLWRAAPDAPAPTHVVHAPGGAAARYCGRELFSSPSYVLCDMAAAPPIPGLKLHEADVDDGGGTRLGFPGSDPNEAAGVVRCHPEPVAGVAMLIFPKPGPWSARSPSATCTLRIAADGSATFRPRALVLDPRAGRAVEELIVVATGRKEGSQRWSLRTRRDIGRGELLRYGLPRGEVDEIVVEVVPSSLPFVKLKSWYVELEPAAPVSP